jgi:hypothetical protein
MATGKEKRKRRKPKPDKPAQSRKFIESAKKLGVDEMGKGFEDVMREVGKKRGGN